MEAMSNSSFDWDGYRMPRIVATENDSMNGVSMLFGYLLTNTAQVFADVRTCGSRSCEASYKSQLDGICKEGIIHLITRISSYRWMRSARIK